MNKKEIKLVDIGTSKINYKIVGNQKIDVIIESGLGSCIAEWLKLANEISKMNHTVLLYERAGTGYSGQSTLKRTPENIAIELKALLEKLDVSDKVIMIGHSQGGLYCQTFARMYKEKIEKMLLIDPLSANDNKFKQLLTKDEFKKSGVDKSSAIGIQELLAKLHLGFIIKTLMKSAPPFYYYKNFTHEETDYILSTFPNQNLYKTVMEEYKLSHLEDNIKNLQKKNSFPDIPIVLITHTSNFSINEIIEFGRTTKEEAEKIETIWQNLMKEYLSFSKTSKHVQAKNSGHYLHLTEPNLILENL